MDYGEVFLDNGITSIFQFGLPERNVEINKLYNELTRYAEQDSYRNNIQNLIGIIESKNEFFIDVINQRGIIIIRGVLDEFGRYMRTIMDSSKKYVRSKQFRRKIVNPLQRFYEVLEKNYERYRYRESNSLIEKIMELLPSATLSGKKISDTDKRLVGMALAFSAIDGERRSILTRDGDICYLMDSLKQTSTNGLVNIRMSASKPVNIIINSILLPSVTNNHGYTIRTRKFYDVLSSKK